MPCYLPGNSRKFFEITKQVTIVLCLFIWEKKGRVIPFPVRGGNLSCWCSPDIVLCLALFSVLPVKVYSWIFALSDSGWQYGSTVTGKYWSISRALLLGLSTSKFGEAAHQKIEGIHSLHWNLPVNRLMWPLGNALYCNGQYNISQTSSKQECKLFGSCCFLENLSDLSHLATRGWWLWCWS